MVPTLRQQAITRDSIDLDLCHMVSIGHDRSNNTCSGRMGPFINPKDIDLQPHFIPI